MTVQTHFLNEQQSITYTGFQSPFQAMLIQTLEAGILLFLPSVPELAGMLFHVKKPPSTTARTRSVILVRDEKGGQLIPLGTLGNSSYHLLFIFALVSSRKF